MTQRKAIPLDNRKLAPEAQAALRLRVVRAIDGAGVTQMKAASLFGVSRSAINTWLAAYRAGGESALLPKKRGPKESPALLKPWQRAVIVKLITDHDPDQLKLPFMLWTRDAVAELIRDRFHLRLGLTTVGRYLKRWGFTPQKPVRKAFEQDSAEVRKWIKTDYPKIASQAKADGAEIQWGDEMGVRSDHHAGRSYAPRGKTPVVRDTGKRFSHNMIASISNRGTLRFRLFKGMFTATVFIGFLERLVKDTRRPVYLIVDRHPVHKSAAVRRWLESHGSLRMFFLPAYSPELNPEELLNHDVKSNAVGRRRNSTPGELEANLRGYLASTQRQPHIVRNFFHHPMVQYAA